MSFFWSEITVQGSVVGEVRLYGFLPDEEPPPNLVILMQGFPPPEFGKRISPHVRKQKSKLEGSAHATGTVSSLQDGIDLPVSWPVIYSWKRL